MWCCCCFQTSVCATAVADQVPGNHIFILGDKEQAAYFLNDLQGLYPSDKRVHFYPSSYRLPYQVEAIDNANVVARAEVLARISKGDNTWVITYPEALFEKVPTQHYKWYPMEVQRNGELHGVHFSTSTILGAGMRAGLIAITIENKTKQNKILMQSIFSNQFKVYRINR